MKGTWRTGLTEDMGFTFKVWYFPIQALQPHT